MTEPPKDCPHQEGWRRTVWPVMQANMPHPNVPDREGMEPCWCLECVAARVHASQWRRP